MLGGLSDVFASFGFVRMIDLSIFVPRDWWDDLIIFGVDIHLSNVSVFLPLEMRS